MQVGDHQVVVGRDGAVHAAARLQAIFAHAHARRLQSPDERRREHGRHVATRMACPIPSPSRARSRRRALRLATEEMLLELAFALGLELAEPIVDQRGRRRRSGCRRRRS